MDGGDANDTVIVCNEPQIVNGVTMEAKANFLVQQGLTRELTVDGITRDIIDGTASEPNGTHPGHVVVSVSDSMVMDVDNVEKFVFYAGNLGDVLEIRGGFGETNLTSFVFYGGPGLDRVLGGGLVSARADSTAAGETFTRATIPRASAPSAPRRRDSGVPAVVGEQESA